MAVRSISAQLAGESSARGYCSSTLTLQVWDELWLVLYLGSGLACWVAGPATALLGFGRIWDFVVALVLAGASPTVRDQVAVRLGPPRLRVLGREHPARTWLRQRLSWLYRLATSDWPTKH